MIYDEAEARELLEDMVLAGIDDLEPGVDELARTATEAAKTAEALRRLLEHHPE